MNNTSYSFIPTPSSIQAWITPEEAAKVIKNETSHDINVSDIYRHALYGNITLSIYFQSPVKIKKITASGGKIKLKACKNDPTYRLCFLNKENFINREYKLIKTEGPFITPDHYILDTPLMGHELLKLQTALADTLSIPRPITGLYDSHYGVLVKDDINIYQVYEISTWEKRIEQQIQKIQTSYFSSPIPPQPPSLSEKKGTFCFPVHLFPDDACFVVKHSHLQNFIHDTNFLSMLSPDIPESRLTSPQARFLWLACKNHPEISPLLDKPYKLFSVFEQWADACGMTEKLNPETLKNILKRGAPPSAA
ncbi:hypothetical protein DS167_20615 [Salmonella enterica subsp. enterica serovar Newport]|nr:hypothetical protein [Salmonella enterica subsp. enterica serovar Newport]MDJ6848914.1 hypothetical protein [Salmonella enterica]